MDLAAALATVHKAGLVTLDASVAEALIADDALPIYALTEVQQELRAVRAATTDKEH